MLDSTATNLADPNSMRDLGQTRNAEYTYQIGKPMTTKQVEHSRRAASLKDPMTIDTSHLYKANHFVRQLHNPHLEEVKNYTKNVS